MMQFLRLLFPQFPKKAKPADPEDLTKALIEAVQCDRNDEVESLLPLMTQLDHDEAIIQAVKCKNINAAFLLISSASDSACSKAFVYAAENGYVELINELLSKEIAQDDIDESFRRACSSGDQKTISALTCRSSKSTLEEVFGIKLNMSKYSTRSRDLALFLIGHVSQDFLSSKLTEAIMKNDVTNARHLVENLEKISLNAFWLSCEKGATEIVQMLIARVDPDACNFHAIRLAIENRHGGVVEVLFPYLDLKQVCIDSLVDLAFQRGCVQALKLLLPLCGGLSVENLMRPVIDMDIEILKVLLLYFSRNEMRESIDQFAPNEINFFEMMINQIDREDLLASTVAVTRTEAPKRL